MKQPKTIKHPFTLERTPVTEAVEIRLSPSEWQNEVVLIAVRTELGAIHASMSSLGVGPALSLSNLQMERPLPRKAVVGWQIELVKAVASGLYEIVEVR